MSLFEVFVDLMDHDKAGDGVRRLGEAKGTFPETFVKIKPLDCQDYPFPLFLFREALKKKTRYFMTSSQKVGR